jgi:hypothetical protein
MCKTAPLADIVYLIHASYIFFIIYYALFAPSSRAWVAAALITLMFLNWSIDPREECVLTAIEGRLRCDPAIKGFTARFIRDVTGIEVDESTFTTRLKLFYMVLLAISAYKFWKTF